VNFFIVFPPRIEKCPMLLERPSGCHQESLKNR
jgi:hypothetical protein